MARSTRFLLLALAGAAVLVLLLAACLPLFLNANSLRLRIESALTASLGRKVTIGTLGLSVWSGGLVAKDVQMADDPRFSNRPFLEATSVKIGVDLLPLLHRQIDVRDIVLEDPQIQLLRTAEGVWNYSTIGHSAAGSAAPSHRQSEGFPSLTIGRVQIRGGLLAVVTAGPVGTPSSRIYRNVNLDIENFGFTRSFSFKASVSLPGGAAVSLKGSAGPIDAQDTSATPFACDLEIKNLDLLAAGLLDPASGVTGHVQTIEVDASWNGRRMHVGKLLVESPELHLLRSPAPAGAQSAGGAKGGATSALQELTVDQAQVNNGSVSLAVAGQAGPPVVYRKLDAQISNLGPASSSPFRLSAELPAGGSLTAQGNVGPLVESDFSATPLNARISLKKADLATSGVLPSDAGIGGIADLQAVVQSNGQSLTAEGTAGVAGIKLARNGRPSTQPLQVKFSVARNERTMSGDLKQGAITVGHAVIHASGTYQTAGPTTALALKVNGDAMPIDDIEAFLPSLGVKLPTGSRLQGGTLSTAVAITGSSSAPILSGPVRLQNTQLAGFDLGSKLQALSRLTGGKIGSATPSGTTIRSFSMTFREAGGAIQANGMALDVAGIGTATGEGAVGANGALNFHVLLKPTELFAGSTGQSGATGGGIAGRLVGIFSGGDPASAIGSLADLAARRGIPVDIGGTTSNPSFAPNLAGLF